jgi:hypothetical protein
VQALCQSDAPKLGIDDHEASISGKCSEVAGGFAGWGAESPYPVRRGRDFSQKLEIRITKSERISNRACFDVRASRFSFQVQGAEAGHAIAATDENTPKIVQI